MHHAASCPESESAAPALRLSAQGFTLESSPARDAAARDRFARTGVLTLPGLLTPGFLQLMAGVWAQDRFDPQTVDGVGARRVEASGRAGAALSLALGRRALLAWLEAATGIGPLAKVAGEVAQHRAGEGPALDWHDDRSHPGRRLGLTVALGGAAYAGGVFELRRKGERRLLARHRHDESGAALVFAVGPGFEHRLTPVTAGGPRTVFAGWAMGA